MVVKKEYSVVIRVRNPGSRAIIDEHTIGPFTHQFNMWQAVKNYVNDKLKEAKHMSLEDQMKEDALAEIETSLRTLGMPTKKIDVALARLRRVNMDDEAWKPFRAYLSRPQKRVTPKVTGEEGNA